MRPLEEEDLVPDGEAGVDAYAPGQTDDAPRPLGAGIRVGQQQGRPPASMALGEAWRPESTISASGSHCSRTYQKGCQDHWCVAPAPT